MNAIDVSHLSKEFRVYKRTSGFLPLVRSLFYRTYEPVRAVSDISFRIKEGELVGFIGPNGAGKTTTLKCLSGLLYPTTGTVRVLGFLPVERKYDFLSKISLVMGQKNQMWWDLPAMDTLLLHKEMYALSTIQFTQHLTELTDLLDAHALLSVPVRQLSLGQRMKVELIASLLHYPKVLFLDEPTIGLDVVMQQTMREFIAAYNKKQNATILLTSHYMADVAHLCKRIIIINHGGIIYDGSLSALITKHAPFKVLTVTFTKPVKKETMEKLGTIVSYTPEKVIVRVSRANHRQVIARFLARFPVEDINSEEPELEDIIRLVFAQTV